MTNSAWLRSNWLCLVFIGFGIILRLIWVNDMEWKYDEQFMYNLCVKDAATHHWETIGMASGGGIVNPGLSIALFTAMAYVVNTPTAMASIVALTNVIAILCFLVFITLKVEKEQRDTWLWGLALASVSPLAVLFSRKIWEQDMLPIFCFLVILFHTNRNKKWGAFFWGFFGALIGQVHMSGLFYAAGLALFTIINDYRNKRNFKWGYWIVGSVIGGIGLIPWAIHLIAPQQGNSANLSIAHILQFNFYLYWLFDSHGINTMYSLHKVFWDFVKEPFVAGHPTYLVGVLHILLGSSGIYTLYRLFGFVKNRVEDIKQKRLLTRLNINLNSVDFYLLAILIGLGMIMTFSGIIVCQHYLIVAFPFTYIFLAKIFEHKRKWFKIIVTLQLLVTVSFMVYIHTHNGAKDGDYGETYGAQIKTP